MPRSVQDSLSPASRPLSRRAALRLWAGALASLGAAFALPSATQSAPTQGGAADPSANAEISIETNRLNFRARFDGQAGQFAVSRLTAQRTDWVPRSAPPSGALWIDGVSVEGGPPITIDGNGGLQLLDRSSRSLALLHSETGLRLDLEFATQTSRAIAARLTLSNTRSRGELRIHAAATLSFPLWEGDWAEVLAADGAPNAWALLREELPASYGNHELRNASAGVYPIVRLAEPNGGMIVAVNSATAWRIDLLRDGQQRFLRAGEYRSDLVLDPGEKARLPEVILIFYRGGPSEAVDELHRYLVDVSLEPPAGWARTPPVIFNTWYAFGTDLYDDGSDSSELRQAARMAAASGVEVFVVDAGWYLGNPLPTTVGDRGQGLHLGGRSAGYARESADNEDNWADSLPDEVSATDFSLGLGSWVENPAKWRAESGSGSMLSSGLRNFSDYVRGLDVLRPDGSVAGKMRFGLWVEPERFDPSYRGPNRIPGRWALRGTPVLDFTRSEVVKGIAERIQRVIDAYGVEYLKVDANQDLGFDPDRRRTGHFWTRWSVGFEQLLNQLRSSNPHLYLEHCASGLKRYWLGLARLVHSSWLDDDLNAGHVAHLLAATDNLMLPRQKTVLLTEDLSTVEDVEALLQTYTGADKHNGGAIGFSNHLQHWSPTEQRAAAEAIQSWKLQVRQID